MWIWFDMKFKEKQETWILNKVERERLQKIELWALKKIINVPVTTPTPAIRPPNDPHSCRQTPTDILENDT